MTKAELRRKILSLRSGLSTDERWRKSAAVCERLFGLEEFQVSETVLFFVGFGSEIETLPMINTALLQGKRVLVPKVNKGRPDLELRQLSDPATQLHSGTMGIPEPDDTCPLTPLEETDLIIVPAVAWD
ncbi:MAG: 5-formyltetrahydrofolate cyclo-ligase, partial [Armatimonadetes bacterium]|nr:5-formyltetrahydrofolate cyclo-ligase [Armatimonadota bacterium]NIM23196.1 5-formyltetrahydrofolate cyclo-ligase [Armatimonadota bacterium]NIM67064.1 5-formyltetrahydrofolate cyclo-ligase [Armatimonadota bacterium]NIM75598.1 5-formyltetrahydrofolate cyclo-ligase [Armatimonadota bacterium]NIN05253.1 5-formyltetrahydrofolate cyclo-ligase [Armatimonadota bacterium]